MKKSLIILFSIILCNKVSSQNINFLGDSLLPSNPSEWFSNKLMQIKTNYTVDMNVKFIFTLTNNESVLCFKTDSVETADSIFSGDTLDAMFYFRELIFYGQFGDYIRNNDRFLEGNYELKIKFYDSNYNYLNDSAVKHIAIIDDYYPYLIGPSDFVSIFDSLLNLTIFKWTNARNSGSADHYYNLKIVEINDSTDIDKLEYCFNNYNSIFDTTILNDTSLVIPFLYDLLDTTKLYAWSIKTYNSINHANPIIANKAVSPPYILKTSSTKRSGTNCNNNDFSDGFETGTLNGWRCYRAIRELGPSRNFVNRKYDACPPETGRHEIRNIGQAADAYTGYTQVPINGGNFALRLGRTQDKGEMQMVSRTFFVGTPNMYINLRYAAVLNFDNVIGHADMPTVQPFMFIHVRHVGGPNGVFYSMKRKMITLWAGMNEPLTQTNGSITGRPWVCDRIDLSAYYGRTVTVTVETGSCINRGHWGYGYVDFCGNVEPTANLIANNTYCNGDPINVNGSNSSNFNMWQYSVQSCDALSTVFYGEEKYLNTNFSNTIPNIFNLNGLIHSTGYKCGYFKIKLRLKTPCSDSWAEDSKIIFISCPAETKAGVDKCCPSSTCNIQIGKVSVAGYNYEWFPKNCLSNFYISNPYFNTSLCSPSATFPMNFIVKVTDQNGCFGFDTMTIYNNTPSITNIVQDSTQNLCDLIITVNGTNYSSAQFNWTDPNTTTNISHNGLSFVFPRYNVAVNVTITLTNPCGSTSQTFTVNQRRLFKRFNGIVGNPYPKMELKFANILLSGLQMTIRENGIADGTPLAYFSATDAKFEIMNRLDFSAIHVWELNNQHFTNGQLSWDGFKGGSRVQGGIVSWRLSLKNCMDRNWVNNFRVRDEWSCSNYKWRLWPPPFEYCAEGNWMYIDGREWNALDLQWK